MSHSDPDPVASIQIDSIRDLPVGQLLIRFCFGAAISAVAGTVSVLTGSEAGGIMLAFPAILPATLTLVEKEESERQAEDLDVGSVLGAAALAAFAVVVWQYIATSSAPLVLFSATAGWLIAAVMLYLSLRALAHRRSRFPSLGELRSASKKP